MLSPRLSPASPPGGGLGVTQEANESSDSFAQRLQDVLTLTANFEKTDAQGEATKISLKSFSVSEAQVVNHAKQTVSPPRQTPFAARITQSAGLTGKKEDFSERISKAIMVVRATMPKASTIWKNRPVSRNSVFQCNR